MNIDNEDPLAVVWAVYRKKKNGRVFRLVTVCLRRETAIEQANALLSQDSSFDYSVRSSRSAASMPDTYKEAART
jgi:hypothetical protein